MKERKKEIQQFFCSKESQAGFSRSDAMLRREETTASDRLLLGSNRRPTSWTNKLTLNR